jgi:hypothetical protein
MMQSAEHPEVFGQFTDKAKSLVSAGAQMLVSDASATISQQAKATSPSQLALQLQAKAVIGAGGVLTEPCQSLSLTESDFLDKLSRESFTAKHSLKAAQLDAAASRLKASNVPQAETQARMEDARRDFESHRATFVTTVFRLNNGLNGVPRDVTRHIASSAALMEVSSDSNLTYAVLRSRGNAFAARRQLNASENLKGWGSKPA